MPVHRSELRASDQRHGLASGFFFMAVWPSGWLSAAHTAALQMDARMAEATGLKIQSSSSSRPLHREDEAHRHRGDMVQTFLHLLSLSCPSFLCSLHPSFLPIFFFFFFYRPTLHGQPARTWSEALGVCGPRLLNNGAGWLIDRPSAVSASNTFPSSLPYIRILCWSGLR